MFPLPPELGYRETLARLESAGWQRAAKGDWALVLRSPEGGRAARVCAFEPAYPLQAALCQAHPENPYLPRVDWHGPIAHGGHVAVLAWLAPADPEAASRFCARLGFEEHLEAPPSAADRERWLAERRADPHLDALHDLLWATHAEGARRLAWFGPPDVRPGNVMQDGSGRLKLVDPFFVEGRLLIAELLRDARAVAEHYPAEALQSFLEIAAFEREPPEPGAERLKEIIAGLRAG